MPSRYDFRMVCPQINMPAAISKKNTPNQRRRTSAGLAGIGMAGSYHVGIAFPSGKITPTSAGAHLDTTTRHGTAKRNAAFTLQHGAMLTTRQPEGCVPVVASRCAPSAVDQTRQSRLLTKTFCSQPAFCENQPQVATRSLELNYANHQTTRHLFGKPTWHARPRV